MILNWLKVKNDHFVMVVTREIVCHRQNTTERKFRNAERKTCYLDRHRRRHPIFITTKVPRVTLPVMTFRTFSRIKAKSDVIKLDVKEWKSSRTENIFSQE